MYNGIINVYKEAGFTSHDVVAKLRGILKQKKIGHTGTLEPDAVGVLPVCLGSGTKLCDMLADKSKEYRAVMRLGLSTDTQDISGKVLQEREVKAGPEEVREAVLSFTGAYEQIPPMYSAIKVDGKKLYELARAGKEIERAARTVQIHHIEIEELRLPQITMLVGCSKGTYIRTLCHDIGEKLGCGGIMTSLIRTRAGAFYIEDSMTLGEIEHDVREGRLEEKIIPVEEMFPDYVKVTVEEVHRKLIDNGNAFYRHMWVEKSDFSSGQRVKVYNTQGRFYGIYEFQVKENRFKPVKIFMEK